MRRLTVALTAGLALLLTGLPAGLPDAEAATRCKIGAATAPKVIDVTSNGTYATVRGCLRRADGSYVQVLGPYPGRVGYNGVIGAANKREGDGKTPAGRFWLRNGFGALTDPGLARPWTVVGANHVWVDDSRSSLYNTMQLAPSNGRWTSAEKLLNRPAYDYAHRRRDGGLRLGVEVDPGHAAEVGGQLGADRDQVTAGRSPAGSAVGSSPRSSACHAACARSSSVRADGRAATGPGRS